MDETTLEMQLLSGQQESNLCPNCGAKDIRTTWMDDTFPYGVGADAVQLTARVPLRTCAACGYQYYDEEAEDVRHEAVCRHLGVQTPAEIQALRKKYGLSRAEFANLTKLGEATIARWERGALIQNAANDLYLRLLRWEENVERLRDMDEEATRRSRPVTGGWEEVWQEMRSALKRQPRIHTLVHRTVNDILEVGEKEIAVRSHHPKGKPKDRRISEAEFRKWWDRLQRGPVSFTGPNITKNSSVTAAIFVTCLPDRVERGEPGQIRLRVKNPE